MKVVKGHAMHAKNETYTENFDKEDMPFFNFKEVQRVEKALWLQGIVINPACTAFAGIRNWYSFLSNFTSILCNKSQHMTDLSNTCYFLYNMKKTATL